MKKNIEEKNKGKEILEKKYRLLESNRRYFTNCRLYCLLHRCRTG